MTTTFDLLTALNFVVVFTIRIVVGGWGWSRLFVSSTNGSEKQPLGIAEESAYIVIIGVLINTMITFTAGCFGLYSRMAEWILWALLSVAGISFRVSFGKKAKVTGEFYGLTVVLCTVVAIATAVILMPKRGEWIAGGWDPGVYVNEGVALSRTASFNPPDPVFYLLTTDEQKAFSRTDKGRTERFPGVAVDFANKTFSFQFSRFTPSFIAFLHRCGGLRAATRINLVLGLLALHILFVLIWKGASMFCAFLAVFFLIMQPLFLYHTHIPVSEMFQLFWILAAGIALVFKENGINRRLLLPLVLAAGVLNRFIFLPFGALFILLSAWLDLKQTGNTKFFLTERITQVAVLLAGASASAATSLISLAEWNFLPLIFFLTTVGTVGAFFLDTSRNSFLKKGIEEITKPSAFLLMGLAFVFIILMFLRPYWDNLLQRYCGFNYRKEADNIIRLVPYIGILPLVIAGIGFCREFLFPLSADRNLRTFVFILFGMSCVFLWKKEVVDIYPWATRRYIDCFVPLVAMLCAFTCEQWRKSRFKTPKILIPLVVIFTAYLMAKPCRHAFKRTEYNGLSAIMAQTASLIDDDEIVLVDHPLWGTPLSLIYGKNVLDGRNLYNRRDTNSMQIALNALQRLVASGRKICLLTSSSGGLKIYPIVPQNVKERWVSDLFVTHKIVHGGKTQDFIDEQISHTFRLFDMQAN